MVEGREVEGNVKGGEIEVSVEVREVRRKLVITVEFSEGRFVLLANILLLLTHFLRFLSRLHFDI